MIEFFPAKGSFLTFPVDAELVGDEDNSKYSVFSQKANQPDRRGPLGGCTPPAASTKSKHHLLHGHQLLVNKHIPSSWAKATISAQGQRVCLDDKPPRRC